LAETRAEIMVEEASTFEPQALEHVIFAVFAREAREAFEAALETRLKTK
jgi:O-acetyl-ADP-ribose deacetylase (regulator of RNase III)